jgi:hypothetical protein
MSMQQPIEQPLPIDNVGQLIANALIDAGIVGIDEDIEQPLINRAFTQVNWLLATWARKRWLCYNIQDYSFVSTGALWYPVGLKQTININPRPDRLEYAFMRILGNSPPGVFATSQNTGPTPVDIPLQIIQSHEDYSRITVKTIGNFAWRIFYQPDWPVGKLYPWPVPQATTYEIHVGFKVVLPRFLNLQQPINFPPEYENALNFCLAKRLRATNQMPPDPEINALAADGLNAIRLGNQAMSTLRMPSVLRRRQRSYSYQGDL